MADALDLPHPGLEEKDFHVVRALTALAGIEHDGAYLLVAIAVGWLAKALRRLISRRF